ncbi:response regulator [Bosea sp. OAE506]|uniref:response regulator transcription factor n=1 Tax=Bosea sp. OAE506 TaxID=2663870 RepID=UPI0033928A44
MVFVQSTELCLKVAKLAQINLQADAYPGRPRCGRRGLIRMDAVSMIEDAGFEVIEAGNADEAVVFLKARPDISIVLTDIDMHGSMDGLKMAHAIRHRCPPVVIIIASGRSHPPRKRCRPRPCSCASPIRGRWSPRRCRRPLSSLGR